MTRIGNGMLALTFAAGAVVAVAGGAAAQERPKISYSESEGGRGPVCVVGEVASDCEGGAVGRPVLIGAPGMVILPGIRPISPVVIGTHASGGDGSDVDVSRTTHDGREIAR